MIFNSYSFLLFFLLFFFIYWFVFPKNIKFQNLLLLIGSYFFYAWANWFFLFFLIGISALNFVLAKYIEKISNTKYKKLLLYVGLFQGVGGLAFFKYYNFFINSIKDLLTYFGFVPYLKTLDILIPIGISFFTFRTISYLLDVEKGKIKATQDWIVFFNYVAFFPALLSGPIDKAKLFMPQLERKREFNYNQASDGIRQIFWGLFKKIVVANNCSTLTDEIFNNYQNLPASSLFIGVFLYTIQIYADFSGYSDMAIGFSKLLGFSISKNFDYPFFSQNIADFWRKWHISLTAWLTEYVFTPLSISFRDYGKLGLIMAIIINFTIIGIWHGANWTYILFGILHGFYYIPLIMNGTMNKKKKISKDNTLPSAIEFFNILRTFFLVMLTFVIFRTESVAQAIDFYRRLFSKTLISFPVLDFSIVFISLFFSFVMIIIEWVNRNEDFGLVFNQKESNFYRWGIYSLLIFVLLFFGEFGGNQFIYFQF